MCVCAVGLNVLGCRDDILGTTCVCVNHIILFTDCQKIGSQLSLVTAATETFHLFSLVFVAALNYTLYKRKRKIVKFFN